MWFDGLTIVNLEDGGSILSGPVADQSALHGLLAKVRDLNLTLISVTRNEPPSNKDRPKRLGIAGDEVYKFIEKFNFTAVCRFLPRLIFLIKP